MAKNITVAGASYTAVPAIEVPITGGGTARYIDEDEAPSGGGYDIESIPNGDGTQTLKIVDGQGGGGNKCEQIIRKSKFVICTRAKNLEFDIYKGVTI